jgi:hypothetical protein
MAASKSAISTTRRVLITALLITAPTAWSSVNHDLKYSQTDLSLAAELLPYEAEKFDPFTGTEIPVYDRIDAFYLPVADVGGLSRPGPKISIYRIDTP